ncbi:SSI family serine proteinase inhibitor [Streptomyces adelaidensis]|uniref:SSI family serine proteinase inhibitor n=1 Tax=Streptomyces adelaidensis TaxID=2796465 RepID=UPI0019065393|nr:SSI family serine proteinase inhibitor [Streptomyces adelaidensis]
MSQSPPALAPIPLPAPVPGLVPLHTPAPSRRTVASGQRPAALGRLLLGAASLAAAAAAGTLTPMAPDAYAAETLPRNTSMPTSPTSPASSVSSVSSVSAPAPGDRLVVTVREAGNGDDGTFELRCHPDGGSHPAVREACGRLDRRTTWGKDPFAPVQPGTMCTMQYGGPATAHVTGTWAGRRVDARFDRGNGCEIARWNELVPVLPDARA